MLEKLMMPTPWGLQTSLQRCAPAPAGMSVEVVGPDFFDEFWMVLMPSWNCAAIPIETACSHSDSCHCCNFGSSIPASYAIGRTIKLAMPCAASKGCGWKWLKAREKSLATAPES